jgi:dephospho-CoA kinase
MTYIIGLTGNIASGKSTVAAMLGQLGALVIDADAVAHEVMKAGTSVYLAVVARFGRGILAQDGEIDRATLGAIVFNDTQALDDLEHLTHPAVIAQTLEQLRMCKREIAVVEAIKLLEAQIQHHCNAIWVVTCTRAQQVERLRVRKLTDSQIELRIDAQPQLWKKLKAAHVIIDNSGCPEMTRQQVQAAWQDIAPMTLRDAPCE